MNIELDKLTNIWNRETSLEYIIQTLESGSDLCIAVCDIDFFVNIDSKIGNAHGDRVLQRIAKYLLTFQNGKVGRYGGDEFIMVFKEAEIESLLMDIEVFRKSFRKQKFLDYDSVYAKVPMTISLGLVSSKQHGREIKHILKAVEIALAQAKKLGRNRTVIAPVDRIQILKNVEVDVTTVAGDGLRGYYGDGFKAEKSRILEPYGVDIDSSGALIFADRGNHCIRAIGENGIIDRVAGNGFYGYEGDGALAIEAKLNKPSGVANGNDGCMYIADTGNHCIRKIRDGKIYTLAGCGKDGYSGDGENAQTAELSRPGGVVVDDLGNVYTNDYGNNVIRMITPEGKIFTVAGNGEYGYLGDGGQAIHASLDRPYGLDVTKDGRSLYIADYRNNCIREVNMENGIIETLCGTGEQGYSGDGSKCTNAKLNGPYWVSTSLAGYLLVADAENHCIRVINLKTKRIETLVGNGNAGYKDGYIKNIGLNTPAGMVVDSKSGILYIADYGNNAIRKVLLKNLPC